MSGVTRNSRRRFLSAGLQLAAVAVGAPQIVSATALAARGQVAPSDQVRIGYIGAGRCANQLTGLPPAGRIVAVADLDLGRAEEFATKQSCRVCRDYRELLDAPDIDAVIIATPDHWHVLPAIHACLAGKDIYLEKPLSLTVREGRLLVDAVRKCGRVLQTGSQRRSMQGHRWGCELVRNGVAGKIHTVIIANYPSPWECQFPAQPVPDKLNWDVWCGMTEPVGFHADIYIQRSNPGWISFRPYSGGEMTGTGAHGFDQIQWALELDHTGPVEISCEGGKLEPVVYAQPESTARGDATDKPRSPGAYALRQRHRGAVGRQRAASRWRIHWRSRQDPDRQQRGHQQSARARADASARSQAAIARGKRSHPGLAERN